MKKNILNIFSNNIFIIICYYILFAVNLLIEGVFLDYLFEAIIASSFLVFILLYRYGFIIYTYNIIKWKFLPYQAPLIIKNRYSKKKIIINCKSKDIAKKYIQSPEELNVIGLEGLSYFSKKGNIEIKKLLINFLEQTNYSEVKKDITNVTEFENTVINSIENIKVSK